VDPTECILIGDRIDCDIVPARLLGMHTILFRTGRHIDQQPRSADELPHAEVASVDELGAAIEEILA
jgi:8-oxo-dGTP diphosphatase/putative hydrolase of the HAD superfamily